jgi:hypothetical protein
MYRYRVPVLLQNITRDKKQCCVCESESGRQKHGESLISIIVFTNPIIEAVAEREPVVDLCEQVAHVARVLGLHLALEPVHLVHVLASNRQHGRLALFDSKITNKRQMGTNRYREFMRILSSFEYLDK